jgi:hypothetical protein
MPSRQTVLEEWTWKTQAMRAMTLAVVRLAWARGTGGEFSALDLPDHGADAHGGVGIAGSVFRLLAEAGIIARVGVFVDGQFFPRTVRNAGGNPISLWRLAHPGLARALLERYGEPPPRPVQMELCVAN